MDECLQSQQLNVQLRMIAEPWLSFEHSRIGSLKLVDSERGCFQFCVNRLFLDTGGAYGNRQGLRMSELRRVEELFAGRHFDLNDLDVLAFSNLDIGMANYFRR
jgi:hypothetical protein